MDIKRATQNLPEVYNRFFFNPEAEKKKSKQKKVDEPVKISTDEGTDFFNSSVDFLDNQKLE